MPEVDGSSVDITPDIVCVIGFQGSGVHQVSGKYSIPETRGEAFDLGLDGSRPVPEGPVGDMAVGPGGLLPGGRPGRIEQALLGQ